MQTRLDFERSAELYACARVDSGDGLWKLHEAMLFWLCAWIRGKRLGLADWEIEDICEDAFSTLALVVAGIPTLPQAACYVRKVALSRALNLALKHETERTMTKLPDHVDPRSAHAGEIFELGDLIDALEKRLSNDSVLVIELLLARELGGEPSAAVLNAKRAWRRSKASVLQSCKDLISSLTH